MDDVDIDATHLSPLGREMDATVSRASSRNDCVHGEVHGWYSPVVTIEPGSQVRAGEETVAADLEQMARLLFVDRLRRWRQVVDRHLQGEPAPRPQRWLRWEEERDAMVVSGTSEDGSVRVTAVGMLQWTAELEPGTVERLDAAALGRACTQAARAVVTQWVGDLRRLNREHFG